MEEAFLNPHRSPLPGPPGPAVRVRPTPTAPDPIGHGPGRAV